VDASPSRGSVVSDPTPALGLALEALDGAALLQVLEVAEHLREQPRRRLRDQLLAVDGGQEVERGRLARPGERGPDAVEPLGDERAVALDVAVEVGERAAVAGQREPDVERVDDVERPQELADRVRRPAVVEVERDPRLERYIARSA